MPPSVKTRHKESGLYQRISQIIENARGNIVREVIDLFFPMINLHSHAPTMCGNLSFLLVRRRSINSQMVQAYWLIGREIVVEEQKGKDRADYGRFLIKNLSVKLAKDFGSGFDESNLRNIRTFYLTYPIRDAVRHELSWTHYRVLMRIENSKARSFYEIECIKNRWSARELERQKGSLLFERLALSKDKKGLLRLARKGQEIESYQNLIKDPYVLEFTGLSPSPKLYENRLERSLVENLSRFLLELGKGFTFLARQKRITLDKDHFFIDLVFYHAILKCYVLIELKIGKITHQDLGQMQMYVNYYPGFCSAKSAQAPRPGFAE